MYCLRIPTHKIPLFSTSGDFAIFRKKIKTINFPVLNSQVQHFLNFYVRRFKQHLRDNQSFCQTDSRMRQGRNAEIDGTKTFDFLLLYSFYFT